MTTGHKNTNGPLQPALNRAHSLLDSLLDGAVILDRFGDAWQLGRQFWYRAYGDSSYVSSFELAQRGPVKVLFDMTRCNELVADRRGSTKPCGDRANRWSYDEEYGSIYPSCDAHQSFHSAMGVAP